MKFLILALALTTQTFASEVCKYEETHNFEEVHHVVSKSSKVFSAVEKSMILAAVTNQDWLGDLNEAQAVLMFNDMEEGDNKPGSNAGSISYYNVKGKQIALVTYYPGDNEYGGFFEVSGNKFKQVAKVGDSFIECE